MWKRNSLSMNRNQTFNITLGLRPHYIVSDSNFLHSIVSAIIDNYFVFFIISQYQGITVLRKIHWKQIGIFQERFPSSQFLPICPYRKTQIHKRNMTLFKEPAPHKLYIAHVQLIWSWTMFIELIVQSCSKLCLSCFGSLSSLIIQWPQLQFEFFIHFS